MSDNCAIYNQVWDRFICYNLFSFKGQKTIFASMAKFLLSFIVHNKMHPALM